MDVKSRTKFIANLWSALKPTEQWLFKEKAEQLKLDYEVAYNAYMQTELQEKKDEEEEKEEEEEEGDEDEDEEGTEEEEKEERMNVNPEMMVKTPKAAFIFFMTMIRPRLVAENPSVPPSPPPPSPLHHLLFSRRLA